MIPRISSISSACGGIVSNLYIPGLDNSTCKIQFTLLLNFESHYVRQASVHFVSEAWDSLKFVGEVDSSHIYIAILKCSGYPLTSWIPCIA